MSEQTTRSQPGPKQFFQTLQLIFFSLFAGQLVFGLLVTFLSLDGSLKSDQEDLIFIMQYVIPTLSVSLIIGSRLLFRVRIRKAEGLSLIEQLKIYQSGSIIRFAMIEAGTLISLVIFLLSGVYFFLYCAIFCLYFFFSHRPQISQIAEDLAWDEQKSALFESNSAI